MTDTSRRDLLLGMGATAALLASAEIGEEVERTLKTTNSLLALCLPPSDDSVLISLDHVVPEALTILGYQARQNGSSIV